MYSYNPKLHHAIIAAGLCILCLIIAGALSGPAIGKAQSKIATAFNLGAFLFGFLFIVVVVMLVLESLNRRVEVMTSFASEIRQMDDEGRAMMAFEFPTMRYKMKRGEVRPYFEDTNVPIELFHDFLRTSNTIYISPRRYWYTTDRPEWAWIEIKSWLEEHGYVQPDSAAGSHSWMWRGNAWNHLKAYWSVGIHLADLNDEPVVMHNPAYTPPPPLEDA